MSAALPNHFFLVLGILSVLAAALTFILNLAIVIIVITTRRCQTVFNLLVCSSCIASILYSVIAIDAGIHCMREDWALEQWACVGKAFVFVLTLTASTYSYSMQALSRLFFAVFYRHRFLLNWRTHWIMTVCNWVLSLLVPIGPLLIPNGLGLERESRLCVVSSKVSSAAILCVVIVFCLPLSAVVTIYVVIYHHARRSTRRVIPETLNGTAHNPGYHTKRELKLMQLLVLQAAAFGSGGILYLMNILWQAGSKTPLPQPLYALGFCLMSYSMPFAGINQFLLNKPVRDAAMKYLRRHFWSHVNRCSWIKNLPIIPRISVLLFLSFASNVQTSEKTTDSHRRLRF